MKQAMNRFYTLIYGADDGLGGIGGLEELALFQLESLLTRRSFSPELNDVSRGEPKQEF